MFNVLGIDLIVFDQVQQHARQEGNVGTGTNRRIDIGHRRGARSAGRRRSAWRRYCFSPPSPSGNPPMGFGGVTAHHHHTTLAFLISTQWLVIAPRPNVEQDLLPLVRVRRAPGCLPPAYPAIAQIFCVSMPVSLLAAEAHSMPVESQRLTVTPCSFFSIKLASRSASHQSGDAVKGFIPGDALPFIRARGAVLRITQTVFAWT